jgi:streptomycin 3"-kinase
MRASGLLPQLPIGKTWIPTSEGESGDAVFGRSDGTAFAKISLGASAAQLDEERLRTEWLAPFGLGSAAVLDWRVSSEGACLVTRTVAGVPASDLSASDLLEAWPSIAERVRALHSIPAADCPFGRGRSAMFGRATDVVARNAVNPDFLDPEHQAVPPSVLLDRLRAELPQRLAQEAHERVVCHGDACLPNFMVDPETLRCTGLVDLGRLGTADRYVDFSLLLGNARESWTTAGEALAARKALFEILGIADPDDGRLGFYLRLDPLTWG